MNEEKYNYYKQSCEVQTEYIVDLEKKLSDKNEEIKGLKKNNEEILLGVLIKDPLNGKVGENCSEEGEKIVNSFGEVFKNFTKDGVKQICEETGCYYKQPPVTMTYLINADKTGSAHEVGTRQFESLESLKQFLKENQGLAICQIDERTDNGKCLLRYYDNIRYKSSLHEKLDSNFYDTTLVLNIFKEEVGKQECFQLKDKIQKILKEEFMKYI
jgi:hypothetical protein